MTRRRAALVALAAVPLLVSPRADASCAAPPDPVRLTAHDLVFAGEVTDTADGGRAAEVRVLDVWRGRDLPPEAVVLGGEGSGQSSVDRTFEKGRTYAFFAYEDDEGVLRDNACTPTAPLVQRAALDPPGVRAPDPDAPRPPDPRSRPWMWWLGGAAAVAAGGAAVILRRR